MEIIHDTIKSEPINSNIKLYPYYVKADAPDRKARMYHVYHEWDRVIEEYIPKDYDLYVSFNYLKPSFLLPPGKKNIAWIHGDVYDLAAENKKEELELQRKGFKVERIGINYKAPEYECYIFKNTRAFQESLNEILDFLKKP